MIKDTSAVDLAGDSSDPTKTNGIGRLTLIGRHEVIDDCIRTSLIIYQFPIVASLPETSVPLAIETREGRSTMLSSMPMVNCTLAQGTRSRSGASSAPCEHRRLSLQPPSLLYPILTADSKGSTSRTRQEEASVWKSLSVSSCPLPSAPFHIRLLLLIRLYESIELIATT